ncbi:MAG: ATP-dependent zinc metalloprotease FtsH [Alphaproteobacteria bacterium]|nr:MAG: ATP-dependent zinc metalloprotease FtsH [Alphaproteobacteria bacterium]
MLAVGFANMFKYSDSSNVRTVYFSEFVSSTERGLVSAVKLYGNHIYGDMKNGQKFLTIVPYQDKDLVSRLLSNKVHIQVSDVRENSLITWISIILSWLPSLLIIGMMMYSMKKMQGGPGKAVGFGKSKAKLVDFFNNKKVTFNDVAGSDEAKEELSEIVDFLKNKQKFSELGARIPKGVLLSGPPGTGKTLLARSVAGEANVPFFAVSGSDFIEMFAGVGASRVRDMFEQAKKQAPCIIFIDEIDALGAKRGSGLGGGYEEREQTLNQLLVEMDGFELNEGVIVLAATNRSGILDPALLRAGRFDRRVALSLPRLNEREQILKLHVKSIKFDEAISLSKIARGTPGFSGADLSNLINEAALLAGRRNKKIVSEEDLEEAKDKLLMGNKVKSKLTDAEKKLTAYHEAGHAIVALHSDNYYPIHKATIIPRGHALGVVVSLPEDDEMSVNKAKLLDQITVAMGGLAAEKIIFGEDYVTTGASSDIQKATDIARNMVSKWGMSSKIGYVNYTYSDDRYSSTSDDTYKNIDIAVRDIIDKCFATAYNLLSMHKDILHTLARKLIEVEEMSGDEIKQLLGMA